MQHERARGFESYHLSDVRVELEHGTQVLERVALLRGLGESLASSAHLSLDLVRVDDAGEVGVVHDGAGKGEGLLHIRGGSVGAENAASPSMGEKSSASACNAKKLMEFSTTDTSTT